MKLLATISKWVKRLSAGAADPWHGLFDMGHLTTTGVRVTEENALNYSAVWAATRILSENIASLPLILYRRLPGGGKSRDARNPLYRVLHDQPNAQMDSFSFWECLVAWLVNWGNAYAEIERDGAGRVIGLWPIHPSRVFVEKLANGTVYHVHSSDGRAIPIPAYRMFHLTGALSDDGILGRGVVDQARESIGLGVATEKYGASFFGKGAKPQGVLKHPKTLSEQATKNMRLSWAATQGGPENFGMPLILEQGTEWVPISIPPEDAQFLQTRQHNITEIARWYRIPPHMLADLSRATFSNVEQQSLDFVVQSLRPWLVRIERAIRRQLIGENEQLLAEFLVDALLRGDTATRTASLTQRWLNGNICQDEWREIENLNPLPDGKGQIYFVPMNLTTLDRMIEGPKEPAPAAPAGDSEDSPADDDEEPEPANAVLGYNPDQPRDERGRFGSGGGAAKAKSPRDPRTKEEHASYIARQESRLAEMQSRKNELMEKKQSGAITREESIELVRLTDKSIIARSMIKDANAGFYRDENHWSNQPIYEQPAAFEESLDSSPELEAKVESVLASGSNSAEKSERVAAAKKSFREQDAAIRSLGMDAKEETAALRRLNQSHIVALDEAENGIARQALVDAIGVNDPVKFGYLNKTQNTPTGNATRPIKFVESLTDSQGFSVASFSVTDSLDDDRAHFNTSTGTMSIAAGFVQDSAIVHEMGHVIENRLPGAAETSQAFLRTRAGNSPMVELAEKFPGEGFMPGEQGRSAGFEGSFESESSQYYAGKVYNLGNSEVLAMGLEEMHRDPIGFIKRDRQYAKFVIGQLDGSLRAQSRQVVNSAMTRPGVGMFDSYDDISPDLKRPTKRGY